MYRILAQCSVYKCLISAYFPFSRMHLSCKNLKKRKNLSISRVSSLNSLFCCKRDKFCFSSAFAYYRDRDYCSSQNNQRKVTVHVKRNDRNDSTDHQTFYSNFSPGFGCICCSFFSVKCSFRPQISDFFYCLTFDETWWSIVDHFCFTVFGVCLQFFYSHQYGIGFNVSFLLKLLSILSASVTVAM